jgi:hypothetical protein
MPAIAHVLFFRGGWLYYLFSSLIFLLFLAVLNSWVKENTPLRFWQFLSLSTCSFVVFQCHFAGYPDILVFTFFVLVMHRGFSQDAKLSLLVLALVAHEASLFVGMVLAWRYLESGYRAAYFLSLGIYGAVWAASYGFEVPTLLASHNVDGMSAWEWVAAAPRAELLGIFMGFKAVWLLPILAVLLAVRHGWYADASFILASVAAGVFLTFLAVDTSRIVGFGFPGVLAAFCTIRHGLPERAATRILSIVLLANLVIPSFYVGLNSWIFVRPGLYGFFCWILVGVKHAIVES